VRIFNSKKWISILGTEKFKKWVKEKFSNLALEKEIPEGKVLTIDVEKIKTTVAESFKVDKTSLLGTKRKTRNDPRDVAIYLTRKNRRDTLEEIGKAFGISRYSTVSTILLNMKERISKERRLKKKLESVEKSLYNDSVNLF